MKRTALLPVIAALPLLAGCVIIDANESDGLESDFAHSDAGRVYGASVHPAHVVFQVTSNGCTDRSYFEVDVDHHGSNRYSLELDRIRPDRCRALVPEGVEVSWSFDELGLPRGAAVEIENPVARR